MASTSLARTVENIITRCKKSCALAPKLDTAYRSYLEPFMANKTRARVIISARVYKSAAAIILA